MSENGTTVIQMPMVRFWSFIDAVVRWLAELMLACSGLCLVALFVIGTADVVGSQLLGIAVPSAFELQEVLMGMTVFGAFAAIQRRRAHIVVDVLSQQFGGAARKLSDLLALSSGTIVFALLAWQTGKLAARSVAVFELSPGYVAFPLYPVKVFVFACNMVALLEFLRQLVRRVVLWGEDGRGVQGG